jgi:hypothetical protein
MACIAPNICLAFSNGCIAFFFAFSSQHREGSPYDLKMANDKKKKWREKHAGVLDGPREENEWREFDNVDATDFDEELFDKSNVFVTKEVFSTPANKINTPARVSRLCSDVSKIVLFFYCYLGCIEFVSCHQADFVPSTSRHIKEKMKVL